MDKFYKFLQTEPNVYYYSYCYEDAPMVIVGSNRVFARYCDPDFKPSPKWLEKPVMGEKLGELLNNAEAAKTVRVKLDEDLTLVIGNRKAVVVKTSQLRLFGKITSYMASNCGDVTAAVMRFAKPVAGIAVITGLALGNMFGCRHELEQAKEMIERVLEANVVA